MKTKRIREYGIAIGSMEPGPLNKITDVPGVLVGHKTIRTETNHTGVTVIIPGPGNTFTQKFVAAGFVHNGFGKTCGLIQLEELGTLETPIALTNTLNVGLVADALVEYTLTQCDKDGIRVTSVNPVVGECNDSRINHIRHRAVTREDVMDAIETASETFLEGDAGAGAGTVCYGLKGGIGSASRSLKADGQTYTLGVLVQSNFGATQDLIVGERPMGQNILKEKERRDHMFTAEQDQGSIMTVIATDLPVTDRQLKRIIRHAGVGIARTGAYTGHGSGEVMIGFTTANRINTRNESDLISLTCIREDLIDQVFKATAEAVNEAILNSMITAGQTQGILGEVYYSLADLLSGI